MNVKYFLAFASMLLLTSCISLSTEKMFVNKNEYSLFPRDIFIEIDSNYRFVAEPVGYYNTSRNSLFPDSANPFMYNFTFSVLNEEHFESSGPVVTVHSLSFTSPKGDTIPYVLFYRDLNPKESLKSGEVHYIRTDSFPVAITEDMVSNTWKNGHSYEIFAECHIPYKPVKIYVDYDIEVNGKRYYVHSLWRKKTFIHVSRLGHG